MGKPRVGVLKWAIHIIALPISAALVVVTVLMYPIFVIRREIDLWKYIVSEGTRDLVRVR
jgi:hypothetical protein